MKSSPEGATKGAKAAKLPRHSHVIDGTLGRGGGGGGGGD